MATERNPVGLDLLRWQVRLGRCQLTALAGNDLAEFDSLAAEREIIAECLRPADLTNCPAASAVFAELRACEDQVELHLIELNASFAARLSRRRAAFRPRQEQLYAYV
jgi:hypothetical protein